MLEAFPTRERSQVQSLMESEEAGRSTAAAISRGYRRLIGELGHDKVGATCLASNRPKAGTETEASVSERGQL